MPSLKLGTHSNRWFDVLRALEGAAGVPQGTGGDHKWLEQLVERINLTKGTDIRYRGENYGYTFDYGSLASAELLGAIKQQNNL